MLACNAFLPAATTSACTAQEEASSGWMRFLKTAYVKDSSSYSYLSEAMGLIRPKVKCTAEAKDACKMQVLQSSFFTLITIVTLRDVKKFNKFEFLPTRLKVIKKSANRHFKYYLM